MDLPVLLPFADESTALSGAPLSGDLLGVIARGAALEALLGRGTAFDNNCPLLPGAGLPDAVAAVLANAGRGCSAASDPLRRDVPGAFAAALLREPLGTGASLPPEAAGLLMLLPDSGLDR